MTYSNVKEEIKTTRDTKVDEDKRNPQGTTAHILVKHDEWHPESKCRKQQDKTLQEGQGVQ
jgi:hypothetical protein